MSKRYAYDFSNNQKEVWNYQTLHAYCTASIRLNLSKNYLLQLSVGSSYMLYLVFCFRHDKYFIFLFSKFNELLIIFIMT